MDIPELHLQLLLDKLTQSPYSFALYRLPWTDEPILVFQEEGKVEKIDSLHELNGKKGFLFAPFCPNSSHPIVLIKDDLHIRGWNNMNDPLSSIVTKDILDTLTGEKAAQTLASDNGNQSLSEEARKEIYIEAFNKFITPLKEKQFEKLVLSRSATYALADDFSPVRAFVTACNSYPRMMISLCHTPESGTWIGSTPEIILNGQQPNWQTVALAGTMAMQGEEMPAEWSPKNQREQYIVSEYIQNVLRTFKSKVTLKGPYTARAGHLVHLKTDFQFTLKNADHLGELLEALHPTPAVCGLPKETAYQFILEHEGYDRSYYSGIIGWLAPDDITHLYVNLRCMRITNLQATLYAGGGILPSSNADAEWEETQIKMNTMRKCLC